MLPCQEDCSKLLGLLSVHILYFQHSYDSAIDSLKQNKNKMNTKIKDWVSMDAQRKMYVDNSHHVCTIPCFFCSSNKTYICVK